MKTLLIILNTILVLCLVIACVCYAVIAAKTPVLILSPINEADYELQTCTLYPLCVERIGTGTVLSGPISGTD